MTADWKSDDRFCKLYKHVLAVEGGYVNDPNDKGGPTKYGIAYNFNQGYLKQFGIIHPSQMQELTQDQAIQVYYRKYYLPSQADELPDTRLALVYFDHVINAGQGAADKILAKLDPKLWHFQGDGKNLNYFWGLTIRFMMYRLWFYVSLKQWGRYGLGWFNRLLHIVDVLPTL